MQTPQSTNQGFFNKKQKNKLIMGIIGLVLVAGYLGIRSCFYNEKPKETSPNIISPQNIVTDSGNQTVIQPQVIQSENKGPIKNEFYRDKNEYHYHIDSQPKTKPTPEPQSKERHLNKEDIGRLENQIPDGYKVTLIFSPYDKEVYNYATEISNKLQSSNHTVEAFLVERIYAQDNPRFLITSIDTNNHRLDIFIHSLPEKH